MSATASMGLVAMNGKTLTAPTTSYEATIARQTLIFQTAMSQKNEIYPPLNRYHSHHYPRSLFSKCRIPIPSRAKSDRYDRS